MPRYVITGSTGHIGNNLIRHIKAQEPEAEITVLLRSPTRIFSGLGIEEKIVDFNNTSSISREISSGDTVIHLAAVIDLTEKRQEEVERVNVGLTHTLCDICLEKKAGFVYLGSVDGIYKDSDGVITEPEAYYPDKIQGSYGISKAKASQYVLDVMNSNPDFTCSIILPSAVVGINDFKPSEIGGIILKCINGGPEIGMHGGYNFVDVKDVCYVIHQAAVRKERGQFIVSGENVSVEDLYGLINNAIGRKCRPIIIPTFLVKLVVPFVKVLNPITIKSLQEPHNYSCQKAVDVLGLVPTKITETVVNTARWFKANKDKFK